MIPQENPDQYLNRHFTHSINTQMICGPNLYVYNVLAVYPGGNHDSYIWRNSNFRNALEEGNFVDGWLLSDSGYPLEPWLMTPIHQPANEAEHLYNTIHIVTRNTIERCFGTIKSRFRCLNKRLNYSPLKVCQIITACCVLHNICIQYNIEIEENPYNEQDEVIQDGLYLPHPHGANVRNNLVQTYFMQQ